MVPGWVWGSEGTSGAGIEEETPKCVPAGKRDGLVYTLMERADTGNEEGQHAHITHTCEAAASEYSLSQNQSRF